MFKNWEDLMKNWLRQGPGGSTQYYNINIKMNEEHFLVQRGILSLEFIFKAHTHTHQLHLYKFWLCVCRIEDKSKKYEILFSVLKCLSGK